MSTNDPLMNLPVPPVDPRDQILFLHNIQSILDKGDFTATYKFALLHSIADLCLIHGDDSGDALKLETRDIAVRFINLYWDQSRIFPSARPGEPAILRQNTDRQAAIVNALASHQNSHLTLNAARKKKKEWRKLVTKVATTVKTQPLWKLQTVGRESNEFLYKKGDGHKTITLLPEVAYCFRSFYGMLINMIRGAWIQRIRKLNPGEIGEKTELSSFLFGEGRAALNPEKYQEILTDYQKGKCFYCEKKLSRSTEIDHFIPWSRYPVDLGHNFVLADKACNNNKSAHLASAHHLEHWLERNQLHGLALADAFDEHSISHDLPVTFSVADWSYSQVSATSGRVWVGKDKQLSPLTGEWKRLFTEYKDAYDSPR